MKTNVALNEVPQTPVEQITKRLAEIESTLQSVKALYDEKDKLTLQLLNIVGVGSEITEGEYIFSVVDNFAEKNTVFRPAAVRRFELAVETVTERAKKIEKAAKKGK